MAFPVDRKCGESSAGDKPTPFLTKTYELVNNAASDDVISWNVDGSSFIVWKQAEVARDWLPKYFKHNNFSSFIRQLNTYGFKKVVPDRWEFSNECFRRGEKKLLCGIQRRKIAATSSSTTATPSSTSILYPCDDPQPQTVSPSDSGEGQLTSSSNYPTPAAISAAELIDENERLKKENLLLNEELNQMKNLCNSICALVSNYRSNEGIHGVKPLNLLPLTGFCKEMAGKNNGGEEDSIRATAEEIRARLFGVRVGAKRWRENGADLQLQPPGGVIKHKPLDKGA